ncbi:MAG: DoxX family protein [Gammaproteobacteria bacterium]|nr:DoxX family protein [Gammaproteobacteria bacterium]
MHPVIDKFGPLVGRILIVLIFLLSGIGKITGFGQMAEMMAGKGLPMATLLLILSIVVEVGGSAMIILGWKARLAALIMLLWMIPVTLVFHPFWTMPEDQAYIQQIMFMKNLSMMGAMIYIMVFGSGPLSLDKK